MIKETGHGPRVNTETAPTLGCSHRRCRGFLFVINSNVYLLNFSLMLRLDSESSKRFVSLLSSRPIDR
jgi:hypothetical protein